MPEAGQRKQISGKLLTQIIFLSDEAAPLDLPPDHQPTEPGGLALRALLFLGNDMVDEHLESLSLRFITVPPGVIAMRDDRTQRRWSVDLPSYRIGAAPVTKAVYSAVTDCPLPSHVDASCPVENVSWLDAVMFCNQLSKRLGFAAAYAIDGDGQDARLIARSDGYRLPTEAEWEYACRAGTLAPRYGVLEEIAWFAENSGGRTHPVGSKQPNTWGIYDTLGNVWEWCWDQYDPEVYGLYRIFRGGGWADRERGCLATNRRRSHPTFRIDDLGFRICRNF